jgi:hypothetical protein
VEEKCAEVVRVARVVAMDTVVRVLSLSLVGGARAYNVVASGSDDATRGRAENATLASRRRGGDMMPRVVSGVAWQSYTNNAGGGVVGRGVDVDVVRVRLRQALWIADSFGASFLVGFSRE